MTDAIFSNPELHAGAVRVIPMRRPGVAATCRCGRAVRLRCERLHHRSDDHCRRRMAGRWWGGRMIRSRLATHRFACSWLFFRLAVRLAPCAGSGVAGCRRSAKSASTVTSTSRLEAAPRWRLPPASADRRRGRHRAHGAADPLRRRCVVRGRAPVRPPVRIRSSAADPVATWRPTPTAFRCFSIPITTI